MTPCVPTCPSAVSCRALEPDPVWPAWPGGWWRRARIALGGVTTLVLMILFTGRSAGAEDPAQAAFTAANKLYEQGRFEDAMNAYQAMAEAGWVSADLFFNLGNASYKAGHHGRAIAAYRHGLRLEPRDPGLLFNLNFVREEVSTGGVNADAWWQRAGTRLTLNEWTGLLGVFFWIWFGLLAAGEWRPAWNRFLRGYTAAAGGTTVLLGACLFVAFQAWNGRPEATVTSREAIVRYGPLDESQVHFQLRDGMEITILDRQDLPSAWLRIRDRAGREGWVKAEDVMELSTRSIKG